MERAGSPQDLAQSLFFPDQESLIGLNKEDLRSLVDLAYRVSLSPEEGIYPNFTFFVPQLNQPLRSPTIIFDPAVHLTSQALKKLAPAIPARPHALIIGKRDGALFASGIVRIEASGLFLGEVSEFRISATFPGLTISIDGPAALTAIITCHSSGFIPMQIFRNGQVLQAYDVLVPKANLICLKAQNAALANLSLPHPRSVGLILEWLLSSALAQAVALRHGGTIVVLPEGISEESLRGALRFTHLISDPDFAQLAIELIKAPNVFEQVWAQQRLSDTAYALAKLTAIDGCVIFNHRLRLLGAGAMIRAHEGQNLPTCVRVRPDTISDMPIGAFDLTRVGARHNSVARLCSAIPGAFAFVISQDAEVRAFYTLDDGTVGVCGPLIPLLGISAHP
jgi:hypothetical protein